jgi:hypothetical protein
MEILQILLTAAAAAVGAYVAIRVKIAELDVRIEHAHEKIGELARAVNRAHERIDDVQRKGH